jgi:hypothetical protein
MKSRIRCKNVRKSIRQSQTGGGKTFEFQFWLTINDGTHKITINDVNHKLFLNKHVFGVLVNEAKIYLNITVKKPKKKTIFSKERKEYLFDVNIDVRTSHDLSERYSYPIIERFARLNKKNLTSNELVLLFFENYNIDDIIDVGFIRKLIAELRFTEDVGTYDPYIEGLFILFIGLKKHLNDIQLAALETV